MIVKIEGCKVDVDEYEEPEGKEWSATFSFVADEDLFKTVSALLRASKFEFVNPNGEIIVAKAKKWSYSTSSDSKYYHMTVELEKYKPTVTMDDIYMAIFRELIHEVRILREILKLKGILSEEDYEELFKNEELVKEINEDIQKWAKNLIEEVKREKEKEEAGKLD